MMSIKLSRLFGRFLVQGRFKNGLRFKTSKSCENDKNPYKKTCNVEEDIPCEKRPRDDDCNILPEQRKNEVKSIDDCKAIATTKPPDECQPVEENYSEDSELVTTDRTPCVVEEDEYEPKVIIIGAGLAGLSAANRLSTMGIKNITILEANNRPGGRIVSAAFGDTIVNLGGVWDDGGTNDANNDYTDNPVMHHAQNMGLLKSNKNLPLALSLVTECDGSPLPLAPSFLALTKMIRILGVAKSMKTTSPYADQGRAVDYVGMRIQQELRGLDEDSKATAARVFAALAILYTGKSYIGSDAFGPYTSIPGSNVKIPLGCNGVLAPLLQDVSKYIKLCKEVVNITWGAISGLDGRRAMVRTLDGCEYCADFIIYTASLGVLRDDHEKVFCPTLPCPKVKSIESIEFESVNKVFLYYKTPINAWRQERISWRLDEEDTKSLKGPLKGLREIKELQGSERVISVLLAGPGAAKAETIPEEKLVSDITSYIRIKTGDFAPFPDAVLRTKWNSNKLFRGARSTSSSALLTDPLPNTGSPYPPVLHFAGDGTSIENPGNTKGAFSSGLREADRIISYLPNKREKYQATDACLQLQAALSA